MKQHQQDLIEALIVLTISIFVVFSVIWIVTSMYDQCRQDGYDDRICTMMLTHRGYPVPDDGSNKDSPVR